MDSGLSSTEALLLGQNSRNGGMFGGEDSWVFFLFFLLAWGGGGFGFGYMAMLTKSTTTFYTQTCLTN